MFNMSLISPEHDLSPFCTWLSDAAPRTEK